MSEQFAEPVEPKPALLSAVPPLGAPLGAPLDALPALTFPAVESPLPRRSATEAVAGALARIAEREPSLHALLHVGGRAALAAARRQDRRVALGRPPGLLAGVPLVVKDNVAVSGMPLTCGSRAMRPGNAVGDALLVRRVRRAGGLVVGKANMDELGMGASTETSAFGPTHNPRDLTRTPGGSSGGSAAAVAGGEVSMAVGTDTGGSIREPAAQCGLVGVKPTYGSIPLAGVVPFAPSLDQAGPLARTVADAALLHEVMAAAAGLHLAATLGAGDLDLSRHRVGVVRQMTGDRNQAGVRSRFEATLALLTALGADVVEVDLPSAACALEAYYVLSSFECVPGLLVYADDEALGPEAARRLAVGRRVAADGRLLANARALVAAAELQVSAAFEDCTLLVSPTLPVVAPRSRARLGRPAVGSAYGLLDGAPNLTGIPALSLPAGDCPDTGLAVGFQLMAPHGEDARLYRVAAALEVAATR